MTWLAVDKDGTEAVFRRKPKRIKTTNKWNDVVKKRRNREYDTGKKSEKY